MKLSRIVLAAFVSTMLAGSVWAQESEKKDSGDGKSEAAGRGRGRRGTGAPGGPGGGNFDPEQMRARMMDRYKEQMGVTDDEWKVLQPKLEKVIAAQRDSRSSGGFGGFGGGPGGGRGGRGSDSSSTTPQSAVSKATSELRTAVEDKNSSADVISKKLVAVREARVKAKEELSKAQKELRELLTQRQEAALFLAGLLE